MLELNLDRRAEKFIEKRPPKHRGQMYRKLEELLVNPVPPDPKPLGGHALLRADVGEYRIVYRVEGSFLHVYLVGKRNDDEVYKKLKRMG